MSGKLTLVFRLLLVLSVVLVSYLTLSKPSGEVHGLINDKLAHGVGFFYLAFVLDGAFPKVRVVWKLGVLCGYGLLIEVLQLNLSYRHFSWLDWLADMAGVFAYLPLRGLVINLFEKFFPDSGSS